MTPQRVLVVDDERPARIRALHLLAADRRFVAVGEARDGIEALEKVEQLAPDLLVLDVQMPGLDGFEVLAALGPTAAQSVIFSTAYESHALRAFEAHAIDYLLKPYEASRFTKALDRAHALGLGAAVQHGLLVSTQSSSRQIALKTVDGVWLSVARDEVLRVAAANKYTTLVFATGEQLVRQPLAAVAARLGAHFVQCHRSEFINIEAIVRLEPWQHGDALLVLSDGSTRVLTRTYRKNLLARFQELGPGHR